MQQGTDGYFSQGDYDLGSFKKLTTMTLDPAFVPLAAHVEKNVPVYDMAALRPALENLDDRKAIMCEWAWVLRKSAGVIALKGAYADTAPIDQASKIFEEIIVEEKASSSGKGDHFAASGANDRIWNSLQKHCLRDPENFALYFGNTAIAAACEAWLGPNYQMTAQVNQVRPGGKAQQAHRDYHLGFQSADSAARYPRHAHEVTATLTLQGAVAHCDMPIESGPTKLLPFSQLYAPGYLAFHDTDHRAWFEEAHVQLALAKGDAVFFNPALFHAAGENVSTDTNRLVNLLQVSSAFGRAMESIDRYAMCIALYPALQKLDLSKAEQEAAIAACAEGYPFPTNLDTDPPVGGNAPPSQADLMRAALADRMTSDDFAALLKAQRTRQRA